MNKGVLMVFTGNGKGKTTSADWGIGGWGEGGMGLDLLA